MKTPLVDRIFKSAGTLGVVLYALFILLPFLWIAVTAFKRQIDVLMSRVVFTPTLSTFEALLTDPHGGFAHNIWNSLVTAGAATVAVLFIASVSAFCLVHKKPPYWLGPLLMGITLLFHIIPQVTYLSSWYIWFRRTELFDTLPGLTFAFTVANLPMGMWLGLRYAQEVPRELIEASELDCTGPWQQFVKVFLPLMRNGLVALGLLVFIFVWSDFVVALNLSDNLAKTVPVAITSFAQSEQVRYAEMAASSLLAMLPALCFLLLGQRYIVAGLLSGSVK
jgi:multiple sugar transport system permease protein